MDFEEFGQALVSALPRESRLFHPDLPSNKEEDHEDDDIFIMN